MEKQDSKHAAIVGFQTTGFGKLIGVPSIDPDQSNYVFYLENANEYRLRIMGAIRQVEAILDRQSDFDAGVVHTAEDLESRLRCELRNAETAMQSCKMSYQLTNFILLDGDAADDQAATFAQQYGMSGAAISKRMKVCPRSESAFGEIEDLGKPREPKGLVTMGWMLGPSITGTDAKLLKKPKETCEARLNRSQARFGEMVRSALDANENNKKKGVVNIKPICITGCDDFEPDRSIFSDVANLPTLPFDVTYWFDSLGSNFSSKTNPGLYVQLTNASNVREIRAYNDAEANPFGVRVNSGKPSVSLFFDEKGMSNNQAPVRLEVDTAKGNTYTIELPS